MDHAEVLERIETAVAGPGGLARMVDDPSPDAVAVRQHIAGCGLCAAEWRAWSVVSLGLATAAPGTLTPRPAMRDRVLAAVEARPRSVSAAGPVASAPPAVASAPAAVASAPAAPPMAAVPGGPRTGITGGTRRQRPATAQQPAATVSRGPRFRWLLLGTAALVLLFVAGAVLGRQLGLGTPEAPRGDPGRVLAEAASILQGGGFGLARLETPNGEPGGVVVVSPGSGRLAVVSSALAAPPEGARYICFLERDGVQTQVGYMRWEPTASGGGLAYWAGPAAPVDLGLARDRFIVQLDTPGAEPALTGEFLG